ncbi:MAG: hypothetical protein WCO84_06870 [bacterium]
MTIVNRENEALITQEYLKSILEYNPETGDFIWIKKTNSKSNRIKVGDIAGTLDTNGYLKIQINGKCYQSHRLAWLYETGSWPKFQIDHKEGINIPNFNKFSNLRDVFEVVNKQNKRKIKSNKLSDENGNVSLILGVSYNKHTKRWRVALTVGKKIIYRANYDNQKDAENDCITKRRELYDGNLS